MKIKAQSNLNLTAVANQFAQAGQNHEPLHSKLSTVANVLNVDEDIKETLTLVYTLASNQSVPVPPKNVINFQQVKFGGPAKVAEYLQRKHRITMSAKLVNSELFDLGLQDGYNQFTYKPTKKGLTYALPSKQPTIQWNIRAVAKLIVARIGSRYATVA